jgi:hypothetical protein
MPPSCSPGLAAAVVGDRRVGCRGAGIGRRAGRYPDGYLSGHAPWAQKCAAKKGGGPVAQNLLPILGQVELCLRPMRSNTTKRSIVCIRCELSLADTMPPIAAVTADTRLGREVPIAAHNVKTAARTSKLTPARPVESSVPTQRARSIESKKEQKPLRNVLHSAYENVFR